MNPEYTLNSRTFYLKYMVLVIFIGFQSCYYDVEEELYPNTECVTTNVSYAQDVVPILTSSCYSCHSAAANLGNVTLEGHANTVKYANNGSLVGSIQHLSGFESMPQGASKLDACKIAKIDAWVKAGSLDN